MPARKIRLLDQCRGTEFRVPYAYDYADWLIGTTKDTNRAKYLYDASGIRIGGRYWLTGNPVTVQHISP